MAPIQDLSVDVYSFFHVTYSVEKTGKAINVGEEFIVKLTVKNISPPISPVKFHVNPFKIKDSKYARSIPHCTDWDIPLNTGPSFVFNLDKMELHPGEEGHLNVKFNAREPVNNYTGPKLPKIPTPIATVFFDTQVDVEGGGTWGTMIPRDVAVTIEPMVPKQTP